MLTENRTLPPTREEVIEFIRRLPDDMFCSRRAVEFEPAWVSVSTIDSPPDAGNMKPYRVEIVFERDLSHNVRNEGLPRFSAVPLD